MKNLEDKAIVEGVISQKNTINSLRLKKEVLKVLKCLYSYQSLSLVDPKTSKPSRVGFKFLKDGKN